HSPALPSAHWPIHRQRLAHAAIHLHGRRPSCLRSLPTALDTHRLHILQIGLAHPPSRRMRMSLPPCRAGLPLVGRRHPTRLGKLVALPLPNWSCISFAEHAVKRTAKSVHYWCQELTFLLQRLLSAYLYPRQFKSDQKLLTNVRSASPMLSIDELSALNKVSNSCRLREYFSPSTLLTCCSCSV